MSVFNSASVLLTEDCNLACKYCYELNSSGHKKNKMSIETAIKVVDFMFESEEKKIHINFFGGEPTLMPEIIDVICDRGTELSKIQDKYFDVSLITNATIMNKKLYSVLKKHHDILTHAQLSVDGPKEIQDENRVTKSGKGTFDTIEKNLPYWKALFGERFNVHGVLNKSSIPKLFDSYIYFRNEWDTKNLWWIPAKSNDYTDEDVEIYHREMGKIYNYIMNIVRRDKSIDEFSSMAPLNHCLTEGFSPMPCGAGNNYITITANGDIWPCHHLYFVDKKRELKLGDVWNGVPDSKTRLYRSYDRNDIIGCEDCDHGHCYRCLAENYEANGNLYVQMKGYHCKFMKVDLYYQKLIKKEIINMGLLKDETNVVSACDVNVADCVGKQGDCPNVVSIKDCKFDRGSECVSYVKTPVEFEDVGGGIIPDKSTDNVVSCGSGGCCESSTDSNKENLKELVDGIISALVKFHSSL